MQNISAVSQTDFGGLALAFWIGAGLALFLLVVLSLVTEILLSRRRDFVMRAIRGILALIFPAIVLIPGILLADHGGIGLGFAMMFYVVLFACFCYYLGRRVGRAQGRQALSELVGLETTESIEDAQDRLFESRMRLPQRTEVVKSISELAKDREAQRLREERAARGEPPVSEVDVVEVEGFINRKSSQSMKERP